MTRSVAVPLSPPPKAPPLNRTLQPGVEKSLPVAQTESALTARPGPAAINTSAKEKQDALTARLASLKPLLEAGLPIKGTSFIVENGVPVERAINFVAGQEVRIETGDGRTYVIMPSVTPEGMMRYSATLIRQTTNSGGGTEITARLPDVVQLPWAGFTLEENDYAVFAFDRDENESL